MIMIAPSLNDELVRGGAATGGSRSQHLSGGPATTAIGRRMGSSRVDKDITKAANVDYLTGALLLLLLGVELAFGSWATRHGSCLEGGTTLGVVDRQR